MDILYKIKRSVFTFIGDIKWSGITHPFWFTINACGYGLRGDHYREVIPLLQPGDIVIRRFEGYIDKWFIPGWWNHAGVYIGGENERVVHAISNGVMCDDILNFMRTDHMIVLRYNKEDPEYINEVVERAKSIVGKEYDFAFDFDKSDRFSCTELASYCHPKLNLKPKKSWQSFYKSVLVADDFVNCEDLSIVWDSRSSSVINLYNKGAVNG